MTTGEKIKNLRKSQGLTQAEMAEKLLVSRRTIIDWENEKYSPQGENLRVICEAFNLSLDYFLDTKGDTIVSPKRNDIKGSIFLGDKHEPLNNLKAFARENSLSFYNDYILYIAISLAAILIAIAMPLRLAIGLILLAIGIVVLIIGIYLNRYIRDKNRNKLVSLMAASNKEKGRLISPLHNLYYLEEDNRLKIYNKNNIVVDANKSSIKEIFLGFNNDIVRGILPERLPKLLAMLSLQIYYNDGEISRISMLAYDDRLPRELIRTSNMITVVELNKLKCKYGKEI